MAQYTTVLANEFNAVRNTVATVLGTGSGTRGYGSTVDSYTVAAGGSIGAAEFTALKTDINRCYRHITNGDATLNSVVTGGQITWANLVSYQTAATYVDTNRDTNGGAVTSSQTSKVLPAGWGNASGNRVATALFTITFTDAEAKRYFFNQNSYITLSGSGAATGGTPKSNAFGTLANGVSNTYNRTNYRTTGDPGTQSQYTGTSPYSLGGDPDGVFATITAIGANVFNGSIQCRDKGGDGNVASNVDINLTFYINLLNISNTTGISTYTPSVSWGAWSYSA
jgi:hypothetical protein